MDCGPACLKCLLSAVGINANYDRLREACQTDVDGTSIDVIEDVAGLLGMPVKQQIIPADAVFDVLDTVAPALAVFHIAGGVPHFVILWRRIGRYVHVMDPAIGRRWLTKEQLERELYRHVQRMPATQFIKHAQMTPFVEWLRSSLRALGAGANADGYVERAIADQTGITLLFLDTAHRFIVRLVRAGVVRAGRESGEVLDRLMALVAQDRKSVRPLLPQQDWAAWPIPDAPGTVELAGAVLLARPRATAGESRARRPTFSELPRVVLRAVEDKPLSVWSEIWAAIGQDGRRSAIALVVGSALGVGVVVAEALLLRASLELPRLLGVVQQRIGAAITFAVFLLVLLLIQLVLFRGGLGLGRIVETQLRVSTLFKIPRLVDSYLRSRTVSDMAQRAHAMHELHEMPQVALATLQGAIELVIIITAITMIDWQSGLIAMLGAGVCAGAMTAMMPAISDREHTFQSHVGALTTSYLDSLLGIIPIRTHAGENTMRHEHESRMVGWLRSGRDAVQAYVLAQGLFGFLVTVTIIAVITSYVLRSSHREGLLLLVFWTQRVPDLARKIVTNLRAWPRLRHRVERLLEPLAAAERPVVHAQPPSAEIRGGQIELQHVSVVAGGKTVLSDVNVAIPPGTHVGVVGRSGAGKSTFVGLLLGLYTPNDGHLLVDGIPLDIAGLEQLRRRIAWVDPAVQLWNRSLLENVLYGSEARPLRPFDVVADQAELKQFVERMPRGLQSSLGESGALVSGGEGQRVRFARALAPADANVVILDEAFRGLDRDRRREMLRRARQLWSSSTILCVTHDVSDTLDLDRVLVFADGKLAEDGHPRQLGKEKDSEYRSLLLAEVEAKARVWGAPGWRHWEIVDGVLAESAGAGGMVLGQKPKSGAA